MQDIIRQSVLSGLPSLLAEYGVDAQDLFRRHNISVDGVEEPDADFSFYEFINLINEAAKLTACPYFGLMLSKHHDISTLGLLGLAMSHSPNVGVAQVVFQRYFNVHVAGATISSTVNGGAFLGTYSVSLPRVENHKQVIELSLGHGVNIFKFLCGEDIYPTGAYFMHDTPENLQPYKRVFNCPLYFNAEYNGVTYPADILLKPVAHKGSPEMHLVYVEHLRKLEAKHPGDIKAQVEHTIKILLPTGTSAITTVAASMDMSKRTLQKRLQEQGVTYQTLLDHVRSDIAKGYLCESSISMTQMAEVLAYSELSAFSRAFKRWFGIAPQKWLASQTS